MAREKISIRVRNDATKSKFTEVDLSFLTEWLGRHASILVAELELFVRGNVSSTPVYNIRKVLQCWSVYSLETKLPVFVDLDGKQLEFQISALRYHFFLSETESGLSLNTTVVRWNLFLGFISFISERKIISPIRVDTPSLVSPPFNEVWLGREEAVGAIQPIGPRNLRKDKDSYNEDLFENISIVHSDQEYISEYTARLNRAVLSIKNCALQDLSELRRKRAECHSLLANISDEQVKELKNPKSRKRFIESRSKLHMMKLPDEHPFLLSNLLYIAMEEMGGVPRQHRSYSSNGEVDSVSNYPHWNYITLYGKNKLLPYMGLMHGFAMAPCLVLLLLELPRINATSLMRARVSDDNGREILLSSSGENEYDEDLTITVDKPRAKKEKSMRLSNLAREVLTFVLEWTKPIREEMVRRGQVEEAKWLWVGVKQNSYKLFNYSQKSAFNSLRLDDRFKSLGKKYNTTRIECFVERHPCLKPWASKITFKSLRLNAGVLEYLKSDGDLVVAARAFGHKSISTTIKNYIPKPLRLAMYERQIRRHQNALIISSLTDENIILQSADFKTREELHVFLKSQPTMVFDDISRVDHEDTSGCRENDGGKVILYENVDALAIAILYQQHLLGAPAKYIDEPDHVTGIKPRFWIDFVDAIQGPLPLAMQDVRTLVEAATRRAPTLKKTVNFPRFEL